MGRRRKEPFERGATYRAKVAFQAERDQFDPAERLVYSRHAVSIYDSMQGWFFYVEDQPRRLRSWDIPLGSPPADVPFEKVAGVHPIVATATAGTADPLAALVEGRRQDDPFVRVALEVAVETGRAVAAACIVRNAKLSRRVTVALLCEAVSSQDPEVARALLDAGVPPVSRAIWPAVWSGSASALEELLARGAEVKRCGRSLASLLEYTERRNHARVAEILRKLG